MMKTTRCALWAAAALLATPLQAQTTLTLGGSDAIGSIIDRMNVRFMCQVLGDLHPT